ncbi:hypothetical protein HC776_02965 [bacterium]|nr:hypothetical protein [bacterium]
MPGLIDSVESPLRQILNTGISIYDIEIRGETRAQPGRQRVWRESWLPLFDAKGQGQVIGIRFC